MRIDSFFKVLHPSSKSKARLGEIHTDHGLIHTPAFVPVATKGTLKGLPPQYIKEIGIQVAFVNTYHLVVHPGADIIAQAGGIHQMARLPIPLMSDSGGFQVFSLGKEKRAATFWSDTSPSLSVKENSAVKGKVAMPEEKAEALILKISQDGVIFRSTHDGSVVEFTPEKSMEYQQKIGADLIMAFDECTYYPATKKYAEKAMDRTHEWLQRCIDYSLKSNIKSQYLYGIIQGATYKDLRQKSAEFIVSLPTSGVAIGGVAVGESKKEVRQQVEWVAPYLPQNRPVHLLGIGDLDDIIELVGYGVDTFDCVEPTRMARMGKVYQIPDMQLAIINGKLSKSDYELDIMKNIYKSDLSALTINCQCYVCTNFTKAYLHHLFKQKELLGYTLATYHNLFVMEQLMSKIRELITEDCL